MPCTIKEAFIGAGVVAAVIVDISRFAVYGTGFHSSHFGAIRADMWPLVAVATSCAFVGANLDKRPFGKITMGFVQKIIGVMLMALSVPIALGIR